MRTLALAALLALGGCSSIYDLAGGTKRGPQAFGGPRTFPDAGPAAPPTN